MVTTLERPPNLAPPAPVPSPAGRAVRRAVSVADIVEQFGDVDLDRIVFDPAPGTATADDLDRVRRETGRLCELIEGTLIEKAVSYDSAAIASELAYLIRSGTRGRKLGWVVGADGFVRLGGRRVRAADVSFVGADQVPGGRIPRSPAYPNLHPDLAVEVLSPSNRPGEMQRKREDFFGAGTRLVWQIDPAAGTCEVYTRVEEPDATIAADGTLDGGDVIPGLSIPLADVLSAVELD